MNSNRLFSVSAVLLGLGLVVTACGDGENDPDGTGGQGGEGTGGASSDSCPTGLLQCSDACVNPKIDSDHCGDCDTACATAEVCVAGSCEPSDCPVDQNRCGDECITLNDNPKHCGDCDTACAAGELCDTGICVTSCGSGLLACDQSCIDPSSNPKLCGAVSCEAGGDRGVVCTETQACVDGACKEFDAGLSWTPSGRIDTATYSVDTGENQVVSDGAGNVLAVWRQGTGTPAAPAPAVDETQRIFSRYYDVATKTWAATVLRVDDETSRPQNLRVAISPNGDTGAALWVSGGTVLKVALWDGASKTWAAPITVSTLAGAIAAGSAITIDADGDVLVAWSQANPTISSLFAKRYVAATATWGTAHEFPGAANEGDLRPSLDANADGAAVVIWEAGLPSVGSGLSASTYDVALDDWSTPQELRADAIGGEVFETTVSLNDEGFAIAAWREQAASGLYDVQTRTFDGTVWSAAAAIEMDGDGYFPNVVVAADGRALLSFGEDRYNVVDDPADSTCRLWTARYDGTAWTSKTALDDISNTTGNICYGSVARLDGRGNAFVAWMNAGGLEMFSLDDWSPKNQLNGEAPAYNDLPWYDVSSSGLGLAAFVLGGVGGVDGAHLYGSTLD